MQQITVNAANGIPGGSIRQKLDLSSVCQATDAFSMLFMQLMGQTICMDQPDTQTGQAGIPGISTAENGVENWIAAGQDPQSVFMGLAEEGKVPLLETALQEPIAGNLLISSAMKAEGELPEASGSSAANAEGMRELYTVLKTAWGNGSEEGASAEGFEPSLLSERAFRAARQLLKQQEEQAAVPVDVESLQAQVDSGRFLTMRPSEQQLPLPSPEEVGQQIKTGILHQTAQGKSEFIIRLQPEGIGEIVVKISDDREHMSLSIFTANPQAARMISQEAAVLQETLRPLQVQVQQVTLLPSDQVVSYASQSALADQRQQQSFAQQYFEQRQQHRGRNWQQEDEAFETAVDQIQTPDSELDAYI